MTDNETIVAERIRRLASPADSSGRRDWGDVLARAEAERAQADTYLAPPSSRVPRRRPAISRRLAVVLTAIAFAIVLAVPPAGVAHRIWTLLSGAPVSERKLSLADWRVLSAANGAEMSKPMRQTLHGVQVTGIRLLAERGGWNFYAVDRVDGKRCYAVGLAGSSNLFAQFSCPGPTFPTQARPILDVSPWEARPNAGQRIGRLVGFAADGVASVGLEAPDGTIHDRTRVEKNVYLLEAPSVREVTAVVAFDGDGQRVFTCTLCVPPMPPPSGIPQNANVSAKHLASQFQTAAGATVSTWVAPEKGGGRCYWIELAEIIASGCPPFPPPDQLTGALSTTGGGTLLIGETAAGIASVRLYYRDGNEQLIHPIEGLIIAEIPARQLAAGHQATKLIAQDESGGQRAKLTLWPSPITRSG
jgi:hypothetical protein